MKNTTNQDQVYLDKEANDFFERNKYNFDEVPEFKKSLIDNFSNYLNTQEIDTIFEVGCHIGDLLNYCIKKFDASRGYGIEPSLKAVQEGKDRFSDTCNIEHGVIGDQLLLEKIPNCDLIIVNDVFCWISRATILQSISNIDKHLNFGGHLIIRDFLPSKNIRNQNKHVHNQEVFCHKVIGSHAKIFEQTGNYQIIHSNVFSDANLDLTTTKEFNLSENRWIDIILRKTWES